MTLLVDIGNSRLKWVLINGADWAEQGVIAHHDLPPETLFTSIWAALPAPQRVVVANVAGKKFAAALRAWAKSTWSVEVEFVIARRKACGVTNAYVEPQRLGADRWAALIGAHRLSAGASCVIDCGSAVTIDALDARGQHLGGLIMPGLSMMREALLRNTDGIAKTARDMDAGKVALLARDTAGAVNGGTLYNLIAMIDRVNGDLAADLQVPLNRVICGGDAVQLLPLLSGDFHHEPDLVLHGMAIIAETTQ
ncbi:MAG: type III pantothenate kinase [Gammaproteobacteria bacterium]